MHLAQKLGIRSWWYGVESAKAYANGDETAIPFIRMDGAMGKNDWERYFFDHVPADYAGVAFIFNEPDFKNQDNLRPLDAVIFLTECIKRRPKTKWVGPNTTTMGTQYPPNQKHLWTLPGEDWLDKFLVHWLNNRQYGYAATGRMMPFFRWGFHYYDTMSRGEHHAGLFTEYLRKTIRTPRIALVNGRPKKVQLPFVNAVVTETGADRPNVLKKWMEHWETAKADSGKPLFSHVGLYTPWMRTDAPYSELAFYRGADEVITPMGRMVKDYLG